MRTQAIALLTVSFFGWLNSSDARYIEHVKAELAHCSKYVGDYEHNPPKKTSAEQDALYVTRAEIDIAIVEQELAAYKKHHTSRASVDEKIKQLERDIEDQPVMADDRPTT
jgi:hypothetical protein